MNFLVVFVFLCICKHPAASGVSAAFAAFAASRVSAAASPGIKIPVSPFRIPDKPILPEQFHVVVEWNEVSINKTTVLEEWYDEHENKGTVSILFDGMQDVLIMDFTTDEVFEIIDGLCVTLNATETHKAGVFGKAGKMLSPSGVLRFGGSLSETYLGKDVVRGIPVDAWEHSGSVPEMGIDNVNILWYFADDDVWTAAIGKAKVPVRSIWYGDRKNEIGRSEPFHYYYDYVKWEPGVTGDLVTFQTPTGVFCPHRINTKEMPKLPSQFVVTMEEIKPEVMLKRTSRFWYDKNRLLARFDHMPSFAFDDEDQLGEFENRALSEVHDFHTGLAYVVDRERGNCSIRAFEDSIEVRPPQPGDDSPIPGMKNPNEIFHYEDSDFHYVGRRILRDVEVDVWIGRANLKVDPDGPPLPPDVTEMTYEWYIMTDDWRAVEGISVESNVPMKMVTYKKKTLNFPVKIVNFNDFDSEKMSILEFDIRSCYRSFPGRRHFQVSIAAGDGTVVRQIDDNLRLFEEGVLETLESVADLRSVRVANILVDDDEDYVYVLFDVTEAPLPATGGIGEAGYPDIPLKDAVKRLESSVALGEFVVKLNVDGDPAKAVFIKALVNSLVETFRPSGRKTTSATTTTPMTKTTPMTPMTTTTTTTTTTAPSKELTNQSPQLTVPVLLAIVIIVPLVIAGLTVVIMFAILRRFKITADNVL